MSKSTLQKNNRLLCDAEAAFIAEDDNINLTETYKSLDELANEGDIVDIKLLDKCFRLINSRYTLKYVPDEQLFTRVFNVFHYMLMNKVFCCLVLLKNICLFTLVSF